MQLSNVTCQDLRNKDEFYNHEFAKKQTYQFSQHNNELGGGNEAIADESCDNVNEIICKNLISEHKTQTVAKVELIILSRINRMTTIKLFIRNHGTCIPSLSQIQERIHKIFDGKDSIESETWQLKGIEWEDDYLKQVKDLKSKGCKNSKKKKKQWLDNEKIIIVGEEGKKLCMLKGDTARNSLNWWELKLN